MHKFTARQAGLEKAGINKCLRELAMSGMPLYACSMCDSKQVSNQGVRKAKVNSMIKGLLTKIKQSKLSPNIVKVKQKQSVAVALVVVVR